VPLQDPPPFILPPRRSTTPPPQLILLAFFFYLSAFSPTFWAKQDSSQIPVGNTHVRELSIFSTCTLLHLPPLPERFINIRHGLFLDVAGWSSRPGADPAGFLFSLLRKFIVFHLSSTSMVSLPFTSLRLWICSCSLKLK